MNTEQQWNQGAIAGSYVYATTGWRRRSLAILMAASVALAQLFFGVTVPGVGTSPEAEASSHGGGEAKGAPRDPEIPLILDLDAFTTNLRPNGNGALYIFNTKLSLHMKTGEDVEKDTEIRHEIESRKDQIRFIIFGILSRKTTDMLKTAEDRETMRNEIVRSINDVLSHCEVEGIFFTKALYTMA